MSTNHEDMNGVETTARGDKAPFVISGPGEYEIKGVFVHGFQVFQITMEKSDLTPSTLFVGKHEPLFPWRTRYNRS